MAPAQQPLSRNEGPVGIVGLGLIGGSIGLDLRRQGRQVCGLVHRSTTAERALQRGLVDRVSTDPAVLQDCALVLLALPLERLLDPDPDLVAAIPAAAVVTDVGSVKQPVLERWQPLHPRFVASHPMAGTAEAGVEAGLAGLFADRPWVVTPTAETDPEALAQVQGLAVSLGARWLSCEAAAHDRAVALISHLPVLVSAALLQSADRGALAALPQQGLPALVRALASSGFADTTRVGGGNPALGTQMARTNQGALLQALRLYQQQLALLEQQVQHGQWSDLEAALGECQQLRPGFVKPT
ncbi:MAG: prephenate/arogenate dehydrogenase [Cyanobacteria bacterium K_DeepCast_35m_m2_023]|nr:prephenate/arogenate dehydrogenase [Cyanobacteria bacterium K_DeepCast_35m_m2_023]